ncbi:hypothetical protein [Hymenobacter antarcticus]|uniref:Outer membrane protein beta-barrel domain-containing protein n=1 Tax=Hymenobacter antarcticus TaxID=486270 RepID=A0ABP7QF89_9BACT
MRLIALFFVLSGLLAASSAGAQAPTSAPASQWGWGIRIGVGPGSTPYGNGRHDYRQTYTGAMASLLATRYFAGPKASLALEALAENQSVRVDYQQSSPSPNFRPQTLTQWRLFVPICLRTGAPNSRAHLLVGAGPTLRLGSPTSDAAYYPRRAELTLLLGAEVRLLPWHRYETTLGLRVHAPLTPSYDYGYPVAYTNQGTYLEAENRREGFTRWFGLVLATTIYPAAGK